MPDDNKAFWDWVRETYGLAAMVQIRGEMGKWKAPWRSDILDTGHPLYQEWLIKTGQIKPEEKEIVVPYVSPDDIKKYVDYQRGHPVIPEGYMLYQDAAVFMDDEGTQYKLLLPTPDLKKLTKSNPSKLLNEAQFLNTRTGEIITDLTKEVPYSGVGTPSTYRDNLLAIITPDDAFSFAAYKAISDELVTMGLPEQYLDLPEVENYLLNQSYNFTSAPQELDLASITEIAIRTVEDPAFSRQMKAAGLYDTDTDKLSEGVVPEGRVTGGGGYEPGLMGSPVKFAEELGEGIVTPTSATVLSQSREEAEKLGATWWIPDAPGIREIYKTKKEEFEGLLSQGYSMEQTPDEAARGLAIAGAQPIQVGQEPPSLTEQFSMPVITQKRLEWESLKKKARSAKMASNKQWRVGL